VYIKLVNYWDKYTEMQHGQQDVKKKTDQMCQKCVRMHVLLHKFTVKTKNEKKKEKKKKEIIK